MSNFESLSTFHKFHRLWTKAVGTPDYDKSEWKLLEAEIIALGAKGKPEFPKKEDCACIEVHSCGKK